MSRRVLPPPTSAERNQAIAKKESKNLQDEPIILDAEPIMESAGSSTIITTKIVEILVRRDEQSSVEELKQLLDAELTYNKRRFEIFREHADLHPDAKEERETKRFRRTQYLILMIFLAPLLGAIPFVSIGAGFLFGTIAMLIVAGVLLNGRERELDVGAFVKMITAITKRKP
jgi:hypothetical protein